MAAHLPEALHFISLQLACHACIALQQSSVSLSAVQEWVVVRILMQLSPEQND